MKKKILFVILSGLADDAESTPLMLASKENIDRFARGGVAGLVKNDEGEHPDSGISNFLLLGYPKEEYPGRGYLEALGANMKIIPGSVYVRADFATVKESMSDDFKTGDYEPHLFVVDRRAGRDSTGVLEMSKAIKEMFLDGVKLDFFKSLGNRGVVSLNSIDVSADVSDSDPCANGKEVLQIRALRDDNNAFKTASALNKFSKETYRILKDHPENKYRKFPANYLLLRDASVYKYVKTFKEKFGFDASCVAASTSMKGIARSMEMQVDDVSGATGDLKTDLRAKVMKALDSLSNHDFVILHIRGCDITSHDKNAKLGSVFLEKIDREVFGRILEYVNFDRTTLVLTSDHPTSSKTGMHVSGMMPFLIYSRGIQPNSVQTLDEVSCKEGPLIDIGNFMEEVIKYT